MLVCVSGLNVVCVPVFLLDRFGFSLPIEKWSNTASFDTDVVVA